MPMRSPSSTEAMPRPRSLCAVSSEGCVIPTNDSFDFPSVAPDPTSDDDIGRRLLDALAKLHPKMVEVVILRYQQGHSDAQIATMLGKSRGVVAVTLYRAR